MPATPPDPPEYTGPRLPAMAAASGAAVRDFPVAVAAYPTGDFDCSREVELVKAVVLYAGHVRLYSPTCSLVRAMSRATFSTEAEVVNKFETTWHGV